MNKELLKGLAIGIVITAIVGFNFLILRNHQQRLATVEKNHHQRLVNIETLLNRAIQQTQRPVSVSVPVPQVPQKKGRRK